MGRPERCTVPGWARRGEQWYTIPLPSSSRAKKQKSCLIARARTSFFGWLNGPADLCMASCSQPVCSDPSISGTEIPRDRFGLVTLTTSKRCEKKMKEVMHHTESTRSKELGGNLGLICYLR
ncbi:BZ3500_MvSof-1268-A1-R1_Chr6-3g09014 [Microbotryum saponariae]|uniref:BZ3500_MvSof-1268-A1-R1_Chr6-3g09014 protein n=1 Tax=Microbotryum saponariae TaxID=289078 RepID=A0A2X0KM73_9BASI|nr:BZ3500_MvSof-1268-A1-R1_Chr6-3g09014 [Microbotryum saponariae]SDA07616.1 BZ3501_MvSof-1269-A2-R1_Chr6-2g08718 [Microbotryum saponariae]